MNSTNDDTLQALSSKPAEQAIVGCGMLHPELLDSDLLPNDFYYNAPRIIWETLVAITRNHSQPDYITIIEHLAGRNVLEEIGGPAYIAMLYAYVPIGVDGDNYIGIIKRLARRRNLAMRAKDLVNCALFEPDEGVDAKSDTIILSILTTERGTAPQHISGLVNEVYKEIETRSKSPGDVWGIKSGFTDWDLIAGGLQPGEVNLVVGEPQVGKSRLTMQVALNVARDGHGVGIFSLEMSALQIVRRAVSLLSKVDSRRMKTGYLVDGDWEKLVQSCDDVSKLPIWIDDCSGLTLETLRSKLSRMKTLSPPVEVYVLDYLYLMDAGTGANRMSTNDRTEHLSRGIKAMTKELNLVGLTVNSVTKEAFDGGNVGMGASRGSGQIVHDCDNMLALSKSKDYTVRNKVIDVKFVKNRDFTRPGSFTLLEYNDVPGFGDVTTRTVDLNLTGVYRG